MDILELNEAFSAQVLACTRALGLQDNDPRINPNGGAISLGHPLGCLVLVFYLQQRDNFKRLTNVML
jgi:hypothetical protein